MTAEIREAPFGSADFETCFAIRMEVFVGEQNVPPEEERDEFDEAGTHLLALWNGEPAGTVRVLTKGAGLIKITRVAVRAAYRKYGIGAALMRAAEARHPGASFMLDAQTQALPFYTKQGYRAEGAEFMEAGIPHFHMVKPAS